MKRFNPLYWLLSSDSKQLYDLLNDDTQWWRSDDYHLWIETRKFRHFENSDDILDMLNEGLWLFPPKLKSDDSVCLWVGSGWGFLDYHNHWYNFNKRIPVHNRIILWSAVTRRIAREEGDGALRLLRILRGEASMRDL